MTEDEEVFIRWEGAQNANNEDIIVSRNAFMLHAYGTLFSGRDGELGFIPDGKLDRPSHKDITSHVAELCLAGLWERVNGGYQVVDETMMGMVRDADPGAEG